MWPKAPPSGKETIGTVLDTVGKKNIETNKTSSYHI